jgi:hypothetical protein
MFDGAIGSCGVLKLANEVVSLEVAESSGGVTLIDRLRNVSWQLEFAVEGSVTACLDGSRIIIKHATRRGDVRYIWTLGEGHVQVSLETDVMGDEPLALPGAFSPPGGVREMAIPFYQGVLIRRQNKVWERTARHGGHSAFSMSMGILFADSAGLLLAHDSPVNWTARYGENVRGPFFHFLQKRCAVEGWSGGTVRIFPVANDLTAACKTYKRLMQSRGAFKTWEEKIAERPMVNDLFGALIAFVGYNKTADVDYADGARRLRAYGFEKVLYYPLRMCHYSLDFKMGGDDPIWLTDDEIAAVKAVEGARVGPWGWTFEALDDPGRRAIFREDRNGPVANWRIDQHQWYQVCTPHQIDFIQQRFGTDMRAMDWIHYDVSACVPGSACLAKHAAHDHRPMSPREDIAWTQRLLSKETNGNRIVCSEGFVDHNTPFYDIGSTKIMPTMNENWSFVPIPMTMLVYHDSCAHTWWELHNYNALPGSAEGGIANSFGVGDVLEGLGAVGSGAPQLKAVLDALSGSAPHVFPFGKQYAWRNFEKRETYSFIVKLEDAAVQEALAAALPVAQLHQRVGKLEMMNFTLLTADGAVQSTEFSDGTRVIGNLSKEPRDVPSVGRLNGYEWRELR